MSPFEATLLPETEKERLCRSLLDEFGIPISSVSSHRQELIIPCVLNKRHQDQERNPTGALNWSKLTYKCLGCQASGGLLWFIAENRHGTTKDARDWLGRETGTDGHLMELAALLRFFDALYAGPQAKPPMPTYAEKVLDPWLLIHPYLTDPPAYDQRGRNLGGRGIPEETLIQHKVGYAEKFSMGFVEDAAGNKQPLPTSERIVLPHFWRDRLVGWQSRRLWDDGTSKYKSTPDFPKYTTIYNYDPEAEVAIVVESMLSVLRHTHRYHLEGTFGANVTEAQLKLIGRHSKVIWMLDNDDAGWTAYEGLFDYKGKQTKDGVLEACSRMTNTYVVENPYNADPGDLDDETFDAVLDLAVPYPVWSRPQALLCHRCGGVTHEGGCGVDQ